MSSVRLRLVSVPQVPRSQTGREYLQCLFRYRAIFGTARPDGIIVTGTEPLAAELRDEPYWGAITQIVDWAEANSVSAVWSCLAAHAAVLHLDGVRRHLLGDKRFGVFDCSMAAVHPLLTGAAMPLRVSHSRWNELHEQELSAARLHNPDPLARSRRRHVHQDSATVCLYSSKAIQNTTRERCCASIAATSAATCVVNATPTRACRTAMWTMSRRSP